MYKVIIVDKPIKSKQELIDEELHIVKYIEINTLYTELEKYEYDLIYIRKGILTDKVKEKIQCDFMELPRNLKQLELNEEQYIAFINLQIINQMIISNISFLEFKDYREEMIIATLVKARIIQETNVDKIIKQICPNKQEEKEVKEITNEVIKRYSLKERQTLKYIFFKNKIKQKIFNEILKNICREMSQKERLKKGDIENGKDKDYNSR